MDQATIPIMSTTDMRSEVATWLNDLDDNFLAAVHAMVGTYVAKQEAETKVEKVEDDPTVSYDVVTGTPRTASELTAILDKEVEAVRRGEFTTFEDFQKESAQWGQRTR
jgi:hypothetical protein